MRQTRGALGRRPPVSVRGRAAPTEIAEVPYLKHREIAVSEALSVSDRVGLCGSSFMPVSKAGDEWWEDGVLCALALPAL